MLHQLIQGQELLFASNETSGPLALIIDGKSLAYALEDDVKDMFLELAVGCASVICCRSSPKQKALVSCILYNTITDHEILKVNATEMNQTLTLF